MSPDESMPQSGPAPSHFSVQLYPYHQQAFHQHYAGPNFQDPLEHQWPPAPPPHRILHPRPSYPQLSTSLPQIHDPHRQPAIYPSPQPVYQSDNVSVIPNVARYQAQPVSYRPPVGSARRVSTLPQSNLPSTHSYHPQVPLPNAAGNVHHQSYTNDHPAPGQYPTPSRHYPQPHHSVTLPFPQPSPADHVPSYSPPSDPYGAAAASIGLQPLPVPSMPPTPPPMFQEDDRMPVPEEKPPRPPSDDEHEIALALAMSKAEMHRKRTEEEILFSQEEEELARAMAESLKMSDQTTHLFGGESSSVSNHASQAASSYQNNGDLSPLQLPINLPEEAPSYVSASQNTTSFNEDVGQNWQVPGYNSLQEPFSGQSRQTSSPSSSMPTAMSSYPTETLVQDPLDNLPIYSDRLSSSLAAMQSLQRTETDESRLVFDDEAYARQLLAEEEDELRQRIEEKGRMDIQRQESDKLPQYTSSGLLSPNATPESTESSQRSSNANEVPQPQLGRGHSVRAPGSVTQMSSSPPSFPANEQRPPLQTAGSSASISSSTQSLHPGRPGMNQVNQPANQSRPPASSTSSAVAGPSSVPLNQSRPHASSTSSAVAGPSSVPQLTRQTSAGVVNPNHFLDRELLNGVSIGFKPPVLSLRLDPMEDPMPNIISLPSKKCPPLHLQTPSWGHMLRLLARLSNTRIEPSIEAMSETKAALKLRTVIQFVLPHPQAVNVWRTVLWFAVDQPVPPNALGAARYACGNPNVLPWSYTQSPVPLLLRNASDTATSKTYTIPATDAIPWPTLPISFPNLALYLHAVLEESRRHSRNDALNGIGKLGKMVQMSYPSVKEDDYDDDGPGRWDLFKRVMGRGNKDKNKGKTNNETYQMVIPFVSDGWG